MSNKQFTKSWHGKLKHDIESVYIKQSSQAQMVYKSTC